MQYQIRALSADNQITALTIDARDEGDARRLAAAQGLFVASIAPARFATAARFGSNGRTAPLSLLLFSQELLALLNAGLTIVECLEALLEKEGHAEVRLILERLLQGLREGKRLSAVMAEQGNLFPVMYVSIVRTAEGTSDLPQALGRFIQYQQRVDTVRTKLVSASIYPAILLIVGSVVSVFLIGFVVPQFASVYQGTGRSLSWTSQLMLDWGLFVKAHAMALLGALAVGGVMSFLAIRRFLANGGLGRVVGSLPGVGERLRTYELARLYMTLGMLLEGGIPIVQALQTAGQVVSVRLRPGLQAAREAVESGNSLSQAFEQHGLTTPISMRMLRVGERSGGLGSMLTQSATFYEGEISRWIDQFSRTVEPVLMAAIGLLVGAIVVVLYMPIFDLAGNL